MSTVKKNSKIIATVGPASRNKEMLWKLHQAGANIFRLNFSHGTHEDHQLTIDWVRELNAENGSNICMLQDLQGPKIRVNQVKDNGVEIKPGDIIEIESGDFDGDAKKISTTYKTIAKDVVAGATILIDDGNLELKVVSTDGTTVKAEVIFGGILKSRKGINLPNTAISEPSLTEKDHKDLLFGLEQNVDWIALSFVRTAQDVIDLKKIIAEKGSKAKVIVKMEKPEAVDNMDAIIEATDALMVARGDLGVEMPFAQVPMIQKEFITKCNKLGKPVIVATQMMESMISNPRPTRAEASDVANAITDGADTVMLSAESAAGQYPIEAVSAMSEIITEVESHTDSTVYHKWYEIESGDSQDSLVSSAVKLGEQTGAQAIIAMTETGSTAFSIAKHRPEADVFIFTNDKELVTRLSLVWGVTAFYYDKSGTTDDVMADVCNILLEKGLVTKGEQVVQTAGMPSWTGAKTNMLKLTTI